MPLSYVLRNLWVRRLTTALTALGMALVVYVFATVLMLSAGLERALVDTGSRDNVLVIRQGAETEVQSSLERDKAAIVAALGEIARGPGGEPLVSRETVVLMVLPRQGSAKPANVTLRGLSPVGALLRPQARLTEGRMFRPGSSEIVAGRRIAEGFAGAGLGERLRFGQREWTVVGIFEAGTTGFGSEIWGDVDQFMQAFRRQAYSSVLFRLADPARYEAVRERLEGDQRLMAEARRETEFYRDQSVLMSKFLTVLGLTLSVVFSIGAVIGAMITMYGSVASRTAEIGTLRAIGFSRASIGRSFLLESLALSLVGGLLGLALAALMQTVTVSTMNWQTFAEIAFGFVLDPAIALKAVVFALTMGLVGGVLPALKAARMNIVDALRAA